MRLKKITAVILCAFLAVTSSACGVDRAGADNRIKVQPGKMDDSVPSAQSESPAKDSVKSSEEPGGLTTQPEESSSDTSRITQLLENMTLHEKVCQMIIVTPESITKTECVTAAGETTKQALKDMPVGGILYSKPNLTSKDQVKTMLANVQSYSAIPLFLTCDEEGGRVNRLMSTVGTTYIGPMLDYKDQGMDAAYENAYTIASDMRALGFNVDMAPVADVWSNPSNTVIGDRAYSDDFDQASVLISSAVKGFHAGGVGTALKHFPGHGDTSEDSHFGAVYITKSLEEIREHELLPFEAGIDAGSDMVMVGHLILSDIDALPAPFSHRIVTELLREELEFDGVVITDGLQMEAMTDYYSSGEIACSAVAAGVDMLLCPADPYEAAAALEDAVKAGKIDENRIDESVCRILSMKMELKIIR